MSVEHAGECEVAMVYDGDGNQVSETVGSTTTKYLVDDLNPTGYAQVLDELVEGPRSPTESEMYPCLWSINAPIDSPPGVPTGL